jgi:hypothetical protein
MRAMSETQIKTEVDTLWASRLREAHLFGRSAASLTAQEKATLDGIVSEVDRRRATLRESAGGAGAAAGDDGGLIDLSGTGLPMAEGVTPAKLAPEPQDDDGKLLDLAGTGVPLAESAPKDGQQLLEKMRESDRASDAETGLIDVGALGVTMREGSYGGDEFGTAENYYAGSETLPLLQDLLTCLPVTLDNGTPNLENEQVKVMIEDLGRGHTLSVVAIGKMKDLVVKHAAEIKALRASRDKQGQDYSSVPDPATGRQVTDDDRGTGLLDLSGDGIPTKAAAV